MPSSTTNDDTRYSLLSDTDRLEDGTDEERKVHRDGSSLSRTTFLWKLFALVELLVILGMALFVFKRNRNSGSPSVYTLAQEAIEYETVVFHNSFGEDATPYQGEPSPELDARWNALYHMGVSKISKEEADKLPNKTAMIPGEPGKYISVRVQVEHCLDMLRQAIMCSPDTAPVVWQWSESLAQNVMTWDVAHTCVKFDKLQEWARERVVHQFDAYARIEGNPVIHH
ncbi:hypothetical protein Clacol_007774 [Clathrus columnatus]|uniref:Uncharacterized protein n=1 Tax=Clathrus columnatus TaxID=1419009 RepID=A0AAV5AKX2_9AGAM|nr:hypothetical protein Clacol_007774 [Clathrus columnatus]